MQDREIAYITMDNHYTQAYARLWECCLGVIAGCSDAWINNEARECSIALILVKSGIRHPNGSVLAPAHPDAHHRMGSQFIGDLPDSGLPNKKRSRMLNVAFQILGTSHSEVQVWEAAQDAQGASKH